MVSVKMPIIRKVVKVGDSRGMTIPKSWLDFLEKENGQEILEVAIEVDKVLTVSPILTKKEASNHE
jgi:antitoxin component of MazEF toxin-antitoxin module